MPFATAGQRVFFRDDSSALDSIVSEHFEPRQNVYLPQEAQGQVQAEAATRAKTALESFSADRIVVNVEADAPTMLVLAHTYYHNWKATVNDRPVPVWRANYCFQAIEVPAGRSRVTVVYRDKAFYVGLGILAVALLGAIVFWSKAR
jgi:uncharacterized membrane protein YfhO